MSFGVSRIAVVACGFAMLVSLGCGGGGGGVKRTLVSISGSVTVDGKPIDGTEVSVMLAPADNSAPLSIPLKPDGTFSGQAVVGKNFVVVAATKSVEAGHSEGKSLGVGKLFLSMESPLEVDVQAGAKLTLEVGEAAAKSMEGKKRVLPGAPAPSPTGGAPSQAHG